MRACNPELTKRLAENPEIMPEANTKIAEVTNPPDTNALGNIKIRMAQYPLTRAMKTSIGDSKFCSDSCSSTDIFLDEDGVIYAILSRSKYLRPFERSS